MYALCVSGAVDTQGFVWKFFYALYINFHSFIHSWSRFVSRQMCDGRALSPSRQTCDGRAALSVARRVMVTP